MRKLAIAALSFSGAILLACYILPGSWLPAAALICAGAGAALLLLRRNWLRGFALAALGCAVGLVAVVVILGLIAAVVYLFLQLHPDLMPA